MIESDIKSAQSRVNILGATQLRRRVRKESGDAEYVPSNSRVVTFKTKTLPHKISIWGCTREVSLYIGPVIQFYNCFRYGHSSKSSKICSNCGSDHDESKSETKEDPKCHIKVPLICSSDISIDIQWTVLQDPCFSDHLPILINYNNFHSPTHPMSKNLLIKYNSSKANWDEYKELVSQLMNTDNYNSLESPQNIIIQVTDQAIPKKKQQRSQA
ncbi:hypothetical protein HHI36_008309 [Cryptolaemus montrouzieri]|uniref:Endonuclease/exonuclease/phosphatase domain-containing protein n=1 Tax=Cryptolaemus montrouzieri TaxID=559131 RepID=A0ABD2MSB5_9CUCU